MTTYEHAATSSPLHDAPQLEATMPPAPWMPLEPLMDLWAAFARVASSTEALRATSQAFAALAGERAALRELHQSTPVYARAPFETQEAVISSLHQASVHWLGAARSLLEQIRLSHLTGRTPPPPDLDMDALLDYTLAQRERVCAIAHSLLREQVRPAGHGDRGRSDLPGNDDGHSTSREGAPLA